MDLIAPKLTLSSFFAEKKFDTLINLFNTELNCCKINLIELSGQKNCIILRSKYFYFKDFPTNLEQN